MAMRSPVQSMNKRSCRTKRRGPRSIRPAGGKVEVFQCASPCLSLAQEQSGHQPPAPRMFGFQHPQVSRVTISFSGRSSALNPALLAKQNLEPLTECAEPLVLSTSSEPGNHPSEPGQAETCDGLPGPSPGSQNPSLASPRGLSSSALFSGSFSSSPLSLDGQVS